MRTLQESCSSHRVLTIRIQDPFVRFCSVKDKSQNLETFNNSKPFSGREPLKAKKLSTTANQSNYSVSKIEKYNNKSKPNPESHENPTYNSSLIWEIMVLNPIHPTYGCPPLQFTHTHTPSIASLYTVLCGIFLIRGAWV